MLGGIAVDKGEGKNLSGRERETIGQPARSEEARRLMDLLGRQGGVKEAARAAAGGDAAQLMEMVNRMMQTREGAELVDTIGKQARQAGLE